MKKRKWKPTTTANIINALIILTMTATANAWNAKYNQFDSADQLKEAAHNWIVYEAIEELEYSGLLDGMHEPLSPETGDYLTPFHYISFGLWYADHVGAGIPEAKNALISGTGTGIYSSYTSNFLVVNYDYEKDGNDIFRTEVRYMTERKGVPENMYLQARWYVNHNAPTIDINQKWSADNVFHFANENKLEMRETDPDHDWGNEPIFGDTIFGAREYGVELFLLAKKFWPANILQTPNLDDLTYYSEYETGRTYMDELFDSNSGFLNADFPSFFVGGNPFICSNRYLDDVADDACVHGPPTWPLWVPKVDEVAFPDSSVFDKDLYRMKLRQTKADKTRRAALIYLGWALHMLGDLSMPEHSADRITPDHPDVENKMDELIATHDVFRRAISSARNQVRNTVVPRMKDDASGYCNSIGAGIDTHGEYAKLWNIFDEMKIRGERFHSTIRSVRNNGDDDDLASFLNLLLTEASVHSAKLIGCFFNGSETAFFPAITASMM